MEVVLAILLVLTLVNTVMHLVILDGFSGEKHEEKDR